MKKYSLSLLIVSTTIVTANELFAQIPNEYLYEPTSSHGFFIGVLGGLNSVKYTTPAIATLNSEPTCSVAKNGSGIAPSFGIAGEIPLGYSMQNFIVLEALYDSKSAKFNIEKTSPYCSAITTDYSATLTYFDVNAGFKYNFIEGPLPRGPSIQLTLEVGMRLTSSFNKSITDSNGNNIQYNTASDAVGIHLGVRGQIMYDIPLSGSLGLRPVIGYDYPISAVDNDGNWTAYSAYAALTLLFLIR
jgi:hypothetical protein